MRTVTVRRRVKATGYAVAKPHRQASACRPLRGKGRPSVTVAAYQAVEETAARGQL
ncbi:hypothetical protein SGFS_017600 [Streptomyces graminofaciens]|uniref:Transposase n=1 Tax=Streptomyces graminofaciens TaxID=68212 RepID=A0ABM7F3R8_9ACTN|nr:hypothetical protein SGFS_017600 [Streptomyces graminofaciens]